MATIRVEVVYALPGRHDAAKVEIAAGSSVRDAIAASRLLVRHPGLDLSRCAVGRFSAELKLDDLLVDGDRVEIYRPLETDPKEARRRRVRAKSR
jgi:hypothetical protein